MKISEIYRSTILSNIENNECRNTVINKIGRCALSISYFTFYLSFLYGSILVASVVVAEIEVRCGFSIITIIGVPKTCRSRNA